jgi:hypothetical protein
MNPRVISVKPLSDYKLELAFSSNETKIFDVKPYLHIGVFKELRHQENFHSVKVDNGSISWIGGQDFCPDTLYLESLDMD